MSKNQADFTLTFRRLGDAALGAASDESVRGLFIDPTMFDQWAARWRQRTSQEPQAPAERREAMHRVNPAFIPRNHRVEAVIQAAMNDDN
ncbi:protein adenylyltransferase SelO family protein, partial [Acinetobacter baumannii]